MWRKLKIFVVAVTVPIWIPALVVLAIPIMVAIMLWQFAEGIVDGKPMGIDGP
jgi:hypothetical protein